MLYPKDIYVLIAREIDDPGVWKIFSTLCKRLFAICRQLVIKQTDHEPINVFTNINIVWWLLPCGKELTISRGWHQNGKLAVQGGHRQGVRHGKFVCWFPNGQLHSIRRYRFGKLHGRYTRWFPTGGKEWVFNFHQNDFHGHCQLWPPNHDRPMVDRYFQYGQLQNINLLRLE